MNDGRERLVRRVVREHRAWIWPLALLAGLNVLALIAGVLPMSRTVANSEARAADAAEDASAAAAELAAAKATRDGRDNATRELAVFYKDVLPAHVAEARRLLQLKIAQLARSHDVTFARSVASPESIRDSDLARLKATIDLVGRYRDVRQFLYELETSTDFVVVDAIQLSEGEDLAGPLDLTLEVSTYFKAVPDVP
jgi:Tfp pilus assembly protein PilO